MIKPEMIIFDYGHTLLYEPEHSTENGNRAIYEYIKDNPDNITFDTFNKTCIDLFAKIKSDRGKLEIHEHHFLRLLFDYLNISISITLDEAEQIIWNGISKGAVMPYAAEMLDFLNSNNIRTAVISNICFSGKALTERLNRLLPNNMFEFVLASSEYIYNKPNRLMFDVALKKAKLSSDMVWYCGDSIETDICGARNAGIFPVLYNYEENGLYTKQNELAVDFDFLHIHDWRELIDILKK